MDKIEIGAIVLAIVVICGVGLYLLGVFENNEKKDFGNKTPNYTSIKNSAANQSSFGGSLKIRIQYDSLFTAGYGRVDKNDDLNLQILKTLI